MRGEIIGVWTEMWRTVWKKLAAHPNAPDDLFCELYRELNSAHVEPLDPATTLADIVDDPEQARVAFRSTRAKALKGEVAVVEFLERAHYAIEDLGSEALTNRYFTLVDAFLEKFSLRYDLRRPFSLHPTLSGMFARLMRDLRAATTSDAVLSTLMRDFEETVRDLKTDRSPRRVKQCIAAQFNLLEAILRQHPNVTANTFGAMCGQTQSWPHEKVKEAAKNIYGFASDYPGIRHGGTPANQLREIDMRDLVGITVVLAGITPYLTEAINSEAIYSD